jgi:hypothetical protein
MNELSRTEALEVRGPTRGAVPGKTSVRLALAKRTMSCIANPDEPLKPRDARRAYPLDPRVDACGSSRRGATT